MELIADSKTMVESCASYVLATAAGWEREIGWTPKKDNFENEAVRVFYQYYTCGHDFVIYLPTIIIVHQSICHLASILITSLLGAVGKVAKSRA